MRLRSATAAFGLLALTACSVGDLGDTDPVTGQSGGPRATAQSAPETPEDASRFLTQATFGPAMDEIAAMQRRSYNGWLDDQLRAQRSGTHLEWVLARKAERDGQLDRNQLYESILRQMVSSPDQLRQRTAFALSQIFVVSIATGEISTEQAASYYDVLSNYAFSNFREILEQVSLHPAMGRYLTFIANQKEDAQGIRTPDENYAREILQLMSIGLVELNPDGTPKAGNPPTYTAEDISQLAKVFTGISWYHDTPTDQTFYGGNAHPERDYRPMIFYPKFHSTSEKRFLGLTIPATQTPDPAGDLKAALDHIFNHPNVGPFISRQLIQRMVTSNPSPAYVQRVAEVFANNGRGVRGDMGAVVKAVLLDPEARNPNAMSDPRFGKLREPLIRLTHLLRAYDGASRSGDWLITDQTSSYGQWPLTSPSVFNFFRPGFSPASRTKTGQAGLVAPELQIVNEVSVVSYANAIRNAVDRGAGSNFENAPDIALNFDDALPLADDPAALVERMDTVFFYGQMPDRLRQQLIDATASVAVNQSGTPEQIATARRRRVQIATYLSLVAPEYLVQR